LSESRPIDLGVAQGSILGPLLFLLYVSDFESWISESKVVGYADDTSISCSSKNVPQLLESLESEAAKVLAYFAANKLVQMPKKLSSSSSGGEMLGNGLSQQCLLVEDWCLSLHLRGYLVWWCLII
jgi:hypothetical protein